MNRRHWITEEGAAARRSRVSGNWLLFAGVVEAFLLSICEEWAEMRTILAARKDPKRENSLYG